MSCHSGILFVRSKNLLYYILKNKSQRISVKVRFFCEKTNRGTIRRQRLEHHVYDIMKTKFYGKHHYSINELEIFEGISLVLWQYKHVQVSYTMLLHGFVLEPLVTPPWGLTLL